MNKIALIGQVNVGKSTLFNRLIEQEKAIISQAPGTTRDRNYGICHWQNKTLTIIDTGGLEFKKGPKDHLQQAVKNQIKRAVKEADLIFFIVQIRPISKSEHGPPISDFEREISRLVKKSKKPTIFVLNKADNPQKRTWANNPTWLGLGFNTPIPISAANGTGVGDLLDKTIKLLPKKSRATQIEPDQEPVKVAIIGRPNVGKSTLLNSLLGKEKVIVSPTPHTTRGPQDTFLKLGPYKSLVLIDTAGIRKQAKIKTGVEKIGVKKSLQTIKKSDVVLFILDVTESISHQDKALIKLVLKSKKGIILIINKCDLLTKQEFNQLKTNIINAIPMIWWAPSIFISAKTGKNVENIFPFIFKVEKNRKQWIENKKLNIFLKSIIMQKNFNPDVWSKIKIRQINIKPPIFNVQTPQKIIKQNLIHPAQLNIIEKQIRKKWNFKGTPIEINLTI